MFTTGPLFHIGEQSEGSEGSEAAGHPAVGDLMCFPPSCQGCSYEGSNVSCFTDECEVKKLNVLAHFN